MEVKAVVVSIPFGFLFIFTGIFVNIVQATCFLFIRPLSKNLHRRIIGVVTEILWLLTIWNMDWWSAIKVQLCTDLETYRLMGKEHAILMPNHICDADVFIIMRLSQHFKCLRGNLMVVKKSSMYIPIHGWAIWFAEYIFLSRNWAKDAKTLMSSFEGLRDFPRPFWLTIFAEGTRMTPDKLVASQEFAISKGLPVPKNVLTPRTKGFVAAVQHMRTFVPAIYDITLAVPNGHRTPSLLGSFSGKPSAVHIHIKRYSTKELPKSDEGIAQWCRDRFVAKDAMLDEFKANDRFNDTVIRDLNRSKKSLIVFICVACTSCVVVMKLTQRFSILSTWEGIASLAAALAIDAIFLHALIEYTKLPQPRKASIN